MGVVGTLGVGVAVRCVGVEHVVITLVVRYGRVVHIGKVPAVFLVPACNGPVIVRKGGDGHAVRDGRLRGGSAPVSGGGGGDGGVSAPVHGSG